MSNIVGDSRRLYARFYDNTKDPAVLVDPAQITFEVKINTGTTKTYTYGADPEVIKESTGVYYLLLVFTDPGTYYIYCKGAGSVFAVNQLTLAVTNKFT
jgi:hypothetical protein